MDENAEKQMQRIIYREANAENYIQRSKCREANAEKQIQKIIYRKTNVPANKKPMPVYMKYSGMGMVL